MENKLKYLVVSDYNLPNAELICDSNGAPKIRVTKVPKSKLRELQGESLCAMMKTCILVFEPIQLSLAEKRALVKVVTWYRDWLGEEMVILDKKK